MGPTHQPSYGLGRLLDGHPLNHLMYAEMPERRAVLSTRKGLCHLWESEGKTSGLEHGVWVTKSSGCVGGGGWVWHAMQCLQEGTAWIGFRAPCPPPPPALPFGHVHLPIAAIRLPTSAMCLPPAPSVQRTINPQKIRSEQECSLNTPFNTYFIWYLNLQPNSLGPQKLRCERKC